MQEYAEESFWRKCGPVIGGLTLLLALGLIGFYILHGLKGASAPEPPKIQEISLVQPPPPPPPPKIEQPPPEEKIKLPEPAPEPKAEETPDQEPPPSADLGLDADGVAGSDGFGLQARKGGNGIIGGGDRNRWYAGLVQRNLQSRLADNDAARGTKYSLIVKLWITADGRIDRFEFVTAAGDSKSDAAIREALSGLRLTEQPPRDLPQPLKLRIVSR